MYIYTIYIYTLHIYAYCVYASICYVLFSSWKVTCNDGYGSLGSQDGRQVFDIYWHTDILVEQPRKRTHKEQNHVETVTQGFSYLLFSISQATTPGPRSRSIIIAADARACWRWAEARAVEIPSATTLQSSDKARPERSSLFGSINPIQSNPIQSINQSLGFSWESTILIVNHSDFSWIDHDCLI